MAESKTKKRDPGQVPLWPALHPDTNNRYTMVGDYAFIESQQVPGWTLRLEADDDADTLRIVAYRGSADGELVATMELTPELITVGKNGVGL